MYFQLQAIKNMQRDFWNKCYSGKKEFIWPVSKIYSNCLIRKRIEIK